MATALPLAKIGGLLVKTLAKPLSKRIKHEFSRYPWSQNILIAIGQGTHTLTSRLTIWSAGYTVRSIKPLDEETALKQGAEFVGEGFILGVSIGVLLNEYTQQTAKARDKEEKQQAQREAERQALQEALVALDARLRALEAPGGAPRSAPESGSAARAATRGTRNDDDGSPGESFWRRWLPWS